MLRTYAVLLAMLILIGCNASIVPTDVFSPTLAPTPKAVATIQLPTITPRPSATSTPSPTATASPTIISTPVRIAPPPGLIYKTENELWRIDNNSTAVRLLERSFDFLSPDGTSVVNLKGTPFLDEMWLIDLTTQAQHNLTEKLDRSICCVTWGPERSNTILFGSWPLQSVGRNSGYLSMIREDGSGYRILDKENTFAGLPAPSPDGVTVAYSGGLTGMFYQQEKGLVPFDPASFGLSVDYLRSPSWSPDGKKMAWAAIKGDRFGFGIFDLVEHTAELIYPYPPTVEWTLAPIWSLDGQWLALLVNNDDSMKKELWAVPVGAPREEHYLQDDPRDDPQAVWSPDSHWLASRNMLFEVSTWQPQLLDLPANAEIVAWVNPTSH